MALQRLAALILVFGALGAFAQEPADEPDAQDDAETVGGQAVTGPPKVGDAVVLQNGKTISGVKVLRDSPVFVEILSAPGAEPFRIPRRQVREVLYGETEAFSDMQAAPAAGAKPDLMPGRELEPGFHQKVTAPLSGEPIAYGATELIAVIRDLRQRTGLTIRLSDGIRAMPESERAWELTVPAGKPLLTLLQEDLTQRFTDLVVDLEYEAVSIRRVEEPKPEPAN